MYKFNGSKSDFLNYLCNNSITYITSQSLLKLSSLSIDSNFTSASDAIFHLFHLPEQHPSKFSAL